jgi:formate dehydrogenase major subunit
VTTENSDWATNCPEYKVTAVQDSRTEAPTGEAAAAEPAVTERVPVAGA